MKTHIIEQQDGSEYVCVDVETALELWKAENIELYFVREDAEGLIEYLEDLYEAIEFDAVGVEDSYYWRSEWEENHSREMSFEDWREKKKQ